MCEKTAQMSGFFISNILTNYFQLYQCLTAIYKIKYNSLLHLVEKSHFNTIYLFLFFLLNALFHHFNV